MNAASVPAPPQADAGEPPRVPAASPGWTLWSRRVATIGLLLFATWIVYLSRSVVRMLLLAAILAFLVQPAVRRLESRRLSRGSAVLVVYLGFVIAALIVMAILLPQVFGQLANLSQNAWQFVLDGQSRTVQGLEALRHLRIGGATLDLSFAVDPAIRAVRDASIPANLIPSPESLVSSAEAALRTMSGIVVSITGLVVTLVITVFFAMRMNIDGPGIMHSLGQLAGEEHNAESAVLLERVGLTWSGFFRGQVKLSIVVGVIVCLGDALLGLPGALLLGILSGTLEVLPSLGPILATVPAILLAITQGSDHLAVSRPVFACIVALFYIAVQQVENTVIVPRIMGNALKLPPLIVMVAVVIGAKVGGIVGAFVAAPCVATVKVVAEYTLAKARGADPYPELRAAPAEEVADGGAGRLTGTGDRGA